MGNQVLIVCFVIVVMTFIDIDHKLILNKLMFPAIAIFLLKRTRKRAHNSERG